MYVQTMAHAVCGGWDAERAPYANAWADTMRAAVTQDEFSRIRREMRGHDVSAELGLVQAPTLVMTRGNAALYSMAVVQEVASGISGAKLVVSPGHWLLPCTDEAINGAVFDFLGWSAAEQPSGSGVESSGTPSPNGYGAAAALSPREREVVALLAEGRTNAEIAQSLDVAASTASRHVHNILTKLGMSRRSEAAAYAVYEGIARPPGVRSPEG